MDQVEQIRSKADIVELIGERVTLKKAGRNFKALCPFHGEKTPSFMVSAERQSFKCFGCGEGGDIYTFLQKYEGMSFLESLEYLAGKTGVRLERFRASSQDMRKKKLLEITHLASEYYAWILHNHEAAGVARDYLKGRGLTSATIKQFGLGYAPSQWRSVSDFLVGKKKYSEEEVESVGLILKSEGGYYDRFRGRVMFPLKDHMGAVVGFSGRVVDSSTKQAKYINSPETQLYFKRKMLYGMYENREHIRKADGVVLVEGELDMIPSWQAGVRNVVAIKGSAFSEDQARLVARITKNMVMALDADLAGEEAVKRAVSIAESMDMSIRVVQILGGKDPGDVATESKSKWREMVKGAVSYYDFYIDSAFSRYDVGTGEGARKIAQEVVPVLSGIENLVVRAHYVSELAKGLGVPEKSVYDEVERFLKKKKLGKLRSEVREIEKSRVTRKDKLEEYLLALTLQKYDKVKSKLEDLQVEWFSLPSVKKIIDSVKKWKKKKFLIAEFGKSMGAELQPMIDNAYLVDLMPMDGTSLVKEYEKIAGEIEELYVRGRLRELSQDIAGAEEKKDKKRLEQLQKEFADLSRKLSR